MLYVLNRKLLRMLAIAIFLLFGAASSAGNWLGGDDASVKDYWVGDRSVEVWSYGRSKRNQGVILFSHGFGFAPWKYTELFERWVDAGYVVYAPLHVDSTDHPNSEDYVGFSGWVARLEDMEFLAKRFGKGGYVAAGHSFGALTALAKGGATTFTSDFSGQVYDDNAEVVLAFSPPAAIPGFIETYGYTDLRAPALIQTGTQDVLFEGDNYEGHLDAYKYALEEGNRYALIFEGVDHYFGGVFDREGIEGPEQIEELNTAADISLLMIETYVDCDYRAYRQLQRKLSDDFPVILQNK